MNKNIAIVITAVILLGMGLITYNEYTTPVSPPYSADTAQKNAAEASAQSADSDSVSPSAKAALAPTPPASLSSPVVVEKKAPPVAPVAPVAPSAPAAPSTAPTASASKGEANSKLPTLMPPSAPASAKAKAVVPAPTAPAAQAANPAPAAPAIAPAAPVTEDPVQKALAASRKESTLPATLVKPETPPAPVAKAAPAEKIIKRISVIRSGDGVTIRLDSNQTPKYKTMRLDKPERLVVDLDGVWKMRAPGVPTNALVSNVRIGDHKEGSRIVIDLKKIPSDIRYLKYEETGLDVRLR